MVRFIYAYGRTYYYYGTYGNQYDLKKELNQIRKRYKNKYFIRRIIKGVILPEITYELYLTKR